MTIKMDGDMTIFQMSEYHRLLADEYQASKDVVIDLVGLDEIDTSGVQLLLSLYKQAGMDGAELVVTGASEQVAKIFKDFNLPQEFIPATEDN